MRIIEIIDLMSSSYLERVVKSFTREYPKKDEDGYREEIKSNTDTLKEYDKVEQRFERTFIDTGEPYSNKILATSVLKALLSKSENSGTQNEIIESVKKHDERLLQLSNDSNALRHLPDNSEKIFKSVLEVALEDNIISRDEMSLLNRLRTKLKINEKDQYVILAHLNHFPKAGNEHHSMSEIKDSLNELQKCGLVFYCNQPTNDREKFFVIPEEIAPALKKLLNIELMDDKFALLLEELTNEQLRRIVKSKNLWVSGTKEELIERTITAGISPSEGLDQLTSSELRDLAGSCKGLNKSGSKSTKINEIIEYFDNLINKSDSSESDDPNEVFYKYFEQLASRDERNLLSLNIINKGKDVDNAFEHATNYMFEKVLGHTLIDQENSDHCDGCMEFSNGELFMWDNKSLMQGSKYKFPDQHMRQFKRYIRDAQIRNGKEVRSFLIITSDVDPNSEINAYKLKHESGSDTDIAIISASDLKEVAESWRKNEKNSGTPFNLEVFNYTGVLDRELLKRRMKIFL